MRSLDSPLELPSALAGMPPVPFAIVRDAARLIDDDAKGLPTSSVAVPLPHTASNPPVQHPLPTFGSGAFRDAWDTEQRRLHWDVLNLERADEEIHCRLPVLCEDVQQISVDHAGLRRDTRNEYERIARSAGQSGTAWAPWQTLAALDLAGYSLDRSRRLRSRIERRVDEETKAVQANTPLLADSSTNRIAPAGISNSGEHGETAEGGITVTRSAGNPNNVLISTTGSPDMVDIRRDPVTEYIVVTVNGETRSFRTTAAWGRRPEELPGALSRLTLETGDGDDTITVGAIDLPLEIDAGAGDDTITFANGDTIVRAGPGRDRITAQATGSYIEGGAGDDVIVLDAGNSVVYAGSGDDVVQGSPGVDYIDGGLGNDEIRGGPGNDIISGGPGDDILAGGDDDDRVITGAGRDTVRVDGTGADVVFMQSGEDIVEGNSDHTARVDVEIAQIPDNLKVKGDSDRITDDLNTFSAMPGIQDMFTSIGDSPHEVVVKEWDDTVTGLRKGSLLSATGEPGPGGSPDVYFNPTNRLDELGGWIPPSVGFFHELDHADDAVHGKVNAAPYSGKDTIDNDTYHLRAVPNSERDAVGLPIDHDKDDRTPERVTRTVHENLLRHLFGLPERWHYRPPAGLR